MHFDLLGFLLGALEPHEMDQVRQALRDDPALRAELDQLRTLLRPLDEATGRGGADSLDETDDGLFPESDDPERADFAAETPDDAFLPPADLLARTMSAIPDGPPPGVDDGDVSLSACGAVPAPAALRPTMRPAEENESRPSWAWLDLVFSGLAAAALFGIVLPGILRGRFEARNVACQNNLREAGVALTTYAFGDPQQQLPPLAAHGNEAFAGVYAVKLRDKELIDRMSPLLCPSLDPPGTQFLRPPSSAAVQAARGQTLLAIQRFSGGSYAYNLGVMSDNRYQSPRYQGRSSFAILGDAPVPVATVSEMSLGKSQPSAVRSALSSANSVGTERVQFGHAGRGVNLLFEDGHVMFLSVGDAMMTRDHPFLNHRGQVEAGVNIDDATLGRSWQPPFQDVRQQ